MASDLLVAPLQNALTLAGIIIVAWQLDPQLTVVSLITAPVVAGSVIWFGPKLKRRAKQGREIRSDLASFVHQTVTSIPLVQAYGAEGRNQEYFESMVDDVVTITQRGVLVNKSFSLAQWLRRGGRPRGRPSGGGVAGLSGKFVRWQSAGLHGLCAAPCKGACENLLKIYSKLKTSEASIERLAEILDQPERLPDEVSGRGGTGNRDAAPRYASETSPTHIGQARLRCGT